MSAGSDGDAPRPQVLDLEAVGASIPGRGVLWSLGGDGDLNVNLARLEAGQEIPTHTNEEVDVLLVVLGGEGVLVTAGGSQRLAPLRLAHLPRGCLRALRARTDLVYLTAHRRRGALSVRRRDAGCR